MAAAEPGAAGLLAVPLASGGWPPVAGLFCATANEAPPTSSALTTIRLFKVVIESSKAACLAIATNLFQ
jgi:hypothetical protein